MRQLGVPNLFAAMAEHDEVHSFVAFDNHPTHWIVLHLFIFGKVTIDPTATVCFSKLNPT